MRLAAWTRRARTRAAWTRATARSVAGVCGGLAAMLLWLAPGFINLIFRMMAGVMGDDLTARAGAGYMMTFGRG